MYIKIVLLLITGTVAVYAALPDDTLVLQAEAMHLTGDGWQVQEHASGNWYKGQPFGAMLGGQNKESGQAVAAVQLPSTGRYRLWVRYLDMLNYRSNTGFTLSGTQERESFKKSFDADKESLRATPEGLKKWGDGFSQWVWDAVEFEATAGSLQVTLEKVHLARTHTFTRCVDLLLFTRDLNFEPRITDLTPLYVKVRMLPQQQTPVAIHFWGRRAFEPWYTEHANINKQGLFHGIGKGAEDMPALRLKAGEETPWVDLAPFLAFGGINQISLYAMRNYTVPESEAAFEFWFSKTSSASGVFKHDKRSGAGDGFIFGVDLATGNFATEMDGSSDSLKMALAVPEVPGRMPLRFPFLTTMALKDVRSTSGAISNELMALQQIGIVSTKIWPSHFIFHKTETPGCLAMPNRERLNSEMSEFADKNRDHANWISLNLMDEPGFDFAHVERCQDCQAGFKPYLASIGVAADEIDKLVLCNQPDGSNHVAKASYYFTRRYLNNIVTEMFRAGTQSTQKYLPGVKTTANFACELLDGNMVSRAVDWYELLESGALTYGWHEDWGGWARTRQVNGFYVDAMRSACRKNGVEFGIYNILCRSPREIQTRAFLALGRGVRAMHFFNYGPWYAITSDANSQRPEIYEAIKRVTFAAGAVEDALLQAQPAQPDAAQLLSVSSDIWYATRDNIFGKERTWLNLLLRHCNVRCDVLSEDDLQTLLGKYKFLFATDKHLKRAALPALIRWVQEGGVLYLGAGALMESEFAEPLGLDEALGLQREPLLKYDNPGRAEYEMLKLKPLGTHAGMNLLGGICAPIERTVTVGRGRVVHVGFFPAISYIASSKRAEAADYSILQYSAAHRQWMGQLLERIGLQPRLTCDNSLIEADLLHGSKGDLLVLSNWNSGREEVEITLLKADKYKNIAPVTGRLLQHKRQGGTLRLKLEVDAGDYILLQR